MQQFDHSALKDLKSDVTSCPAEGKIVSEIRDDLLYHPSVGFFTYDGARWARISDEEVKARIAKALGRFKSGSKCNSIITLLKAETARVVEFNRQNKVNFINGTLDLDTLEFSSDHNPNDFLTYCMKYPYKPGKYYSPWSNFIEDIMNGDERKQSLMQGSSRIRSVPEQRVSEVLCFNRFRCKRKIGIYEHFNRYFRRRKCI